MNDDLHDDSPIPKLDQLEIARLVDSTASKAAFENALRRILSDREGNFAAHGTSPVSDD